MKAYLFWFGLLTCAPLSAQEKAVELLNEVYCLGTISCRPSLTLAVELPPNTKRWFYTIRATKSPKKATLIQKDPSLFSTFPSLGAASEIRNEKRQPVPVSDGICSVYLLKNKSDTETFMVAGGAYFYYGEYSRRNVPTVGMIIDDPILCNGTQYLGLENSRAFTESYNMYAVLTVVALTE